MSPSNTHISIYNALFNFIGHLRFWGDFYLFYDLSGVKKQPLFHKNGCFLFVLL
nr:MAG TPA: hypothetical protein [Bacteriophage sp.]